MYRSRLQLPRALQEDGEAEEMKGDTKTEASLNPFSHQEQMPIAGHAVYFESLYSKYTAM